MRDGASDSAHFMTRKQALVRGGGLALSVSALLAACGDSDETGGGAAIGAGLGIKTLGELEPFEFSSATGEKPSLPERLSFANVNTAEIYTLLAQGMKSACDDRGLSFAESNAQTNVSKNVSQIQAFLQRGTGGLLTVPLGEGTQDAVSRQALQAGVLLFGLTTGPSTCQIVADQYRVGQAHGEAAVAWIRENLAGKAKVAYFNLDAIAPSLIARHKGAIDALKAAPGLEIIDRPVGQANFSPEGGFKLVSSLLQAEPDVDAILGADTFILGAAKAVKAAGNDTVRYIAGVDGEALVLNQIREGGLIKATHGFAWPVMGFALGQFTADWLEGKTIPQAIVVQPILLDSPQAIEEFETKQADPAEHWKAGYQDFLGSISYETRKDYLRNTLTGDKG